MEIIVEPSKIVVRAEGEDLAFLDFSRVKEELLVLHKTSICIMGRGMGLCSKMIGELVTLARRENRKVVALCPIAERELHRKSDYQDVLMEN